MKDITKKYIKDELTVVWKPALCIHSTICFKGLPQVFNPRIRPWIKPENASATDIVQQVKRCPSGALSYYLEDTKSALKTEDGGYKIHVSPDGPLLVNGKFTIIHKDGKETLVDGNTALCRCGESKNKPFCDGSHNSINFDT